MKTLNFLLFVCTVCLGETANITNEDSIMLVIDWPPVVCKSELCNTLFALHDIDGFTLHGVWLQKKNAQGLKDSIDCRYGFYANLGEEFNISALKNDPVLFKKLKERWISLKDTDQDGDIDFEDTKAFWKYEYDKHGKCYPDFFNAYGNFQGATYGYFKYAIDLFDIANPNRKLRRLIDGKQTSVGAVQQVFGWNKIKITCHGNKTSKVIVEIGICYTIKDRLPTNCPTDDSSTCGRYPLNFSFFDRFKGEL